MSLMVTLDPSLAQRHPKGLTSATDVVSAKEGKFIYCFTERGEAAYPSCLSLSDGRQVIGLEGAELETISYRGIAAVVSPLRTATFNQLQEEALEESIATYQEVNNRIFQSRTVVPVRFGTVADDPLQVRELLHKVYLQIKAATKRLEGKIELVVRASWDLHAVLQEVKSQMPIESSGAADLQQKIAIGRRVFEVVDKRKRSIIKTIHHGLYPLAVDFSVGSMRQSPVCVPGTGRKEMIFDHSYLVEREKEALFDQAVNLLANEYEGRVSFKYIGPLPPYGFTRLEIAQGNFEVVDEARKTLGLPERSSLEQIKACYRGLSLALHPDRNPDDPSAEERFKKVSRSYEILETYCQNNRWLEEGRIYSFTKEDVESAVMVRSGSRYIQSVVNHRKVRHSRESGNPGLSPPAIGERNWIPGQARNDK